MGYEMWAEKYRPKSLDEMANQTGIVERLKSFVEAKNVPHCIFAGPPGTGKTTAALCLAHDLYGKGYREHLMELNASDERGINVVRETVKTFARTRAIGEIPFKLLILDEVDNMCLHPDTGVTVGKLGNLKIVSLRELQEEYGDRWFDIPSLNTRMLRIEDDKGKIVNSGTADLYRITLEDGKYILASPEHPFFKMHHGLKVVRAKELKPGVEILDFGDKFLICDWCGRVFYRCYPAGFYRHFCSAKCRNLFIGSLSKERSPEERTLIGLKGAMAMKAKGIYISDDYRRKRSEIVKRLHREGRLGSTYFKPGHPGYWLQ